MACVRGRRAWPVDQAHDRSGHVAGARSVDARHFGRFAAEERAACGAAGLRHTEYDGGHVFGHELVGGDIVEEEKGSRALHQNVVETMIDDVEADTLPAVVLRGKLYFGADAVCGSHKEGLRRQFGKGELAAEAADVGEHVRREGRAHGLLHQVDGPVAGFDVDA